MSRAWCRAGAFAVTLTGCLAYHRGTMPGEPPAASYANVRGVRVRYVDEGTGPAIVLLHGYASSLETWDGVREAVLPGHRVIALDLKGWGWSDRPPGDYSIEEQARLVFALLDRLAVDRVVIVAHSWGTSVGLAMALQAPDRVAKLALYDPLAYENQLSSFFEWSQISGIGEILFALFYTERPDERLEQAFYNPAVIPQSLIDAVERAFDRPGTRAAALATVRGMRLQPMTERYATITVPALLLAGADDHVTGVAAVERLANDLPNARTVVFPECGHFPMIEAHNASNRELLEFLAEAIP